MPAEPAVLGTQTPVSLKLELLQHTGSFKARGAANRVLSAERLPPAGLIAASGGNHGVAVAWIAGELGVPAEIFVPEVCPQVKIEKLRSLGATVHVGGAFYADAKAACVQRQAESGALDVHPYDHPATVAGAGTVGREIAEQLNGAVDKVVVSVGGGGLAAGIAASLAGRAQVIAVEPETSCAWHAAKAAGAPVQVDVSGVAADSLGAPSIGAIAYEILDRLGAASVLVSDDAIRAAQHRFWDAYRLVVEPGGAAAAAALLSGAYRPEPGERVAVVVCGSNAPVDSIVA